MTPIDLDALEKKCRRTWHYMRSRCRPKSGAAHRYFLRGIRVCDNWAHSYDSFRAHIGPPPTLRHTIDRIDNDRGYEPGNVRWATAKENCRNTSTNRIVTIDGITKTMAEWLEVYPIQMSTVYFRLARGWTARDAIATPPLETDQFSELARSNGVKRSTYHYRIRKLGWSPMDAATRPVLIKRRAVPC